MSETNHRQGELVSPEEEVFDGVRGRWVPDPDDPEQEVWEELPPRTTPESAAEWDAMLAKNDAARCVAHRKNGERCRRLAIQGATVCRAHGGASGHVRRAARVRLEMAADRVAKELQKLAVSDDAPDNVKLAAIKDALDRAGLTSKTAVEVSVDPKPFEQLLSGLAGVSGGSRAASRIARGVEDGTDPAEPDDWLEAEIVEAQADDEDDARPVPVPSRPEPLPDPEPANGTGMLTMEEALEQLRSVQPPPAAPANRRAMRQPRR
ncbi:hypothetical protein ACLQ3K_00630 [Tsukamurella sp. DT100]|uniref:hypothetical protein n=1 Tax=Tsukamurella sp. DT100 TaxID=3393415 RepID=UPI003CF0373D